MMDYYCICSRIKPKGGITDESEKRDIIGKNR
jgi:hypothetical protein